MNKQLVFAGLLASLVATFVPATVAHAAKQPQASDAQYTILCQTYDGPQHAQAARQAKDVLIKATKLPDWYVVTSEAESNLFYGFYRSFDDAKDADTVRAQNDRNKLGALTDTNGNRPFQFAVFVPIAGSDPVAPPEWDLTNAKGYFSLQVAAYMDSPLRKQAAVDAVKDARARGIEAYYYHGKSASLVCIGAWDREAVREQESSVAQTNDPNQPVLVSTTPLPPSMKNLRTKDTGQKVKVLVPDFQPLDPTLVAAMKQFPTHSINGETVVRRHTKDGQETVVEDPSFLVYVPAKEEVVRQDPELQKRAVELGIAPPPSGAAKARGGQLKSIGQ
jgi:hypothetical protein